ncbi:Probable RNA-directed DNA polymerase from transposon BS [Eumeta japonica]|uniref:Probable RNA-directed DNA polymerase from transposon BS n=1 Tax=Eumeta variegata TaxID=151549 RepID=A0A4C1X710_EUMVA|nr:Probable RNA-directed DNA polymerase from transposon BS [Eumeta japonica]
MSEISPNHKAYWGLTKTLKTEAAVPTPALRKFDNSVAFDYREKAECLADSIEHQCSENLPYDLEHVRRVEEEVCHRVSLPPKDDLDPITHDKVSKHIKGPKIRKAPGKDTISSKALKLDNTYSSMRPLRAGLSQGSTLSPLLYSAYVNDIPRPSTGVQLALLADDTALYLRSNSIGNILPRLQRAIDELTQWLRLWRIEVNPDKRAADTPWYVENSVLHRDLELSTISKFMKDATEHFFDIASTHPNPLLVSAVSYEPPPTHHFCRRPRNVLIDPPDELTVEVEKLLKLNKIDFD